MITEVGGTVGDIESQPFLEAIRQIRHEIGRDRCFFLHVSLLPYIGPSGELKTKPTQHSVAALRSIGIQPDAIVCRSDRPISGGLKRKISLMCDVDEEAVVSAPDAPSIYDIPKVLHAEGLDAYVVRRLGLPFRDVDWTDWDDAAAPGAQPGPRGHDRAGRQVRRPAGRLPVPGRGAARGRVRQRCPGQHPLGDQRRLPDPRGRGPPARRRGRGARARRFRRARHRGKDRRGAVRPHARHPAARAVPRPAVHGHRGRPRPGRAGRGQQRGVRARDPVPGDRDHGRTRRTWWQGSGTWAAPCGSASTRPCWPRAAWCASCTAPTWWRNGTGTGTRSTTPTGTCWSRPGWPAPGLSPDGRLVEFVELPRSVHPFFVATQAHPEFLSRPTRPHPLFSGLVAARARAVTGWWPRPTRPRRQPAEGGCERVAAAGQAQSRIGTREAGVRT